MRDFLEDTLAEMGPIEFAALVSVVFYLLYLLGS